MPAEAAAKTACRWACPPRWRRANGGSLSWRLWTRSRGSVRLVALDLVLLVGRFPPAWRATLTAVEGAAARLGLRTRVFGSLMWQYLSGLPYVGPASDIDLLWSLPPDHAGRCDALLQALLRIQARGGPRIDGEILANGGAVQWRELAMAGTTICCS